MKDMSRRELLKAGVIGAAGLATGAMFLPKNIYAKLLPPIVKNNTATNTALTLIEQAKMVRNRGDLLTANTMETFARSSGVLQYLPFEDITGNAMCFNRDLGGGRVYRVAETLSICGGDMDMDTAFENHKNSRQFYAVQNAMKIKSLAGALSRVIVKGDNEKEAAAFNGLHIRCTEEQQIINNNGVLQISKLDELITSVDKPTHLLMNKTMRRRVDQQCSGNSLIDYELDYFGRRIATYKNLPILIADKDNEYDELLPFSEPDPSGVPQCTSIYCLSLAKNGLIGLQNCPMIVTYFGKLDTRPVFRTRIEWYIGLTTIRPRSIARLRHIKDGIVKA